MLNVMPSECDTHDECTEICSYFFFSESHAVNRQKIILFLFSSVDLFLCYFSEWPDFHKFNSCFSFLFCKFRLKVTVAASVSRHNDENPMCSLKEKCAFITYITCF